MSNKTTFYEELTTLHSVTVARNLGAEVEVTFDSRPEVAHRPFLVSMTGTWEQMYDFSEYKRTRETKGAEVDLFIIGDPNRHYQQRWLTDKEAANLEACGEQIARKWDKPASSEREVWEGLVHFYEVMLNPKGVMESSGITYICMLGFRKPSEEEALRFLTKFNLVGSDYEVTWIRETSKDQAAKGYDFGNMAEHPIFGVVDQVSQAEVGETDESTEVKSEEGAQNFGAIKDKIAEYLLDAAHTVELEQFLCYPLSDDIPKEALEQKVQEILDQLPEEELLRCESEYFASESDTYEATVHYYEVLISPSSDEEDPNAYWLCIKGVREPSVEEAMQFLTAQEDLGECERVLSVERIDEVSARQDYNFDNETQWRVFGAYEAIEDKITEYLLNTAPTDELEDFLGYPISADILEDGLADKIREILDQMPEEELLKYENKYFTAATPETSSTKKPRTGRYTKVDLVVYNDGAVHYLLTGENIPKDLEVDLKADCSFNLEHGIEFYRDREWSVSSLWGLIEFVTRHRIDLSGRLGTNLSEHIGCDRLYVGSEKEMVIFNDLSFEWVEER